MTGFTTRPELLGTFGMAATTHWLASATAMAMLERGGNAFDAATAAALVLHVAEPHLNGPGGDGPILLYDAHRREPRVLCGQGPAPAAATIAAYRTLGFDIMPGTGLLAACVPGAFDAWMVLLRDYGTMAPEEVMAPAIGYAARGCPLVPKAVATIESVRTLFETEWTSSAAIWLPGGSPPAANGLYRNTALAATYRRLLGEAEACGGDRSMRIEALRRAWRQGFVAEAIDRFVRVAAMDSSGQRNAGLLTGADMTGWEPGYESPLALQYRGHTVLKCGPWSQGPVLLQQLALLEGFDLAGMPPDGPDFIHLLVEAGKLAFADREAFYGDPNFGRVPIETLLSEAYNRERRALIGETAAEGLTPGTAPGHGGAVDYRAALARAGRTAAGANEPTAARLPEPAHRTPARQAGDTCHVDVIDRWGNMVSATPSGGWLQSSPAVPELGFALGTRAQMFWLEDHHPASLAPGKRPRTTLTPSMVLRDGEPYMAFGTPGGDQQDQWQLSFLLHHIDHGQSLQAAIDAPSFHSEHGISSFWPRGAAPQRLVLEGRYPAATVAELRRRGHAVEVAGDWSEGRLSAASQEVTPEGRVLRAAANPRGMQGYAAGR